MSLLAEASSTVQYLTSIGAMGLFAVLIWYGLLPFVSTLIDQHRKDREQRRVDDHNRRLAHSAKEVEEIDARIKMMSSTTSAQDAMLEVMSRMESSQKIIQDLIVDSHSELRKTHQDIRSLAVAINAQVHGSENP